MCYSNENCVIAVIICVYRKKCKQEIHFSHKIGILFYTENHWYSSESMLQFYGKYMDLYWIKSDKQSKMVLSS